MASRRWATLLRPRAIATSLTFAAAGTTTAYVLSSAGSPSAVFNDTLDAIAIGSQGFLRSSRAIYTFAANSIDYKYSLMWYHYKSEEYYEVRSLVHVRAAGRILKLCEANKGFYIKAGQFVASLQQMPKEYVTVLSVLQDQALSCPFTVVESVLKEEFGSNAMEKFKDFEEQPVAAASLAQVHRATLNDGREVAIKVQYPMLQQQFRIDISTMDILSQAVAWLFPDYQFQWLVPEFEKTALKELDFEQEAKNAERTSRYFKNNRSIKIPRIFWEMTTCRVLTMEFIHGFKIDDLEKLRSSGVDPRKVAKVLIDVFAEMIFLHGYVHGDPHPGNILIQCKPGTKGNMFQLVLLDHGLYRELDEHFRLDYCHLWKALVLLDPIETQKVGERLGAGKYFKYLPVIFTGRTMKSTSGLGEGMSSEERKQLRDEVRMLTFGDISQFMEGLPRDLLIVLRTDGLLRSIVSKLGAQPRMRLLINAKYAASGLLIKKSKVAGHERQAWTSTVMSYIDYVNLHAHLELLELHFLMKDIYDTWMRLVKSIKQLSIWRHILLLG